RPPPTLPTDMPCRCSGPPPVPPSPYTTLFRSLDSVVPLEPATMPGRVVVQWDKEDCADLGIIKVDLLGLGMMAAIEEMITLVDGDRKSTRLNSSHGSISYAVFSLKKNNHTAAT